MAPTMRRHSCSSSFLMARASIIGVMPSAHLILASLKACSMLMSMKSTPRVLPATSNRFISLITAAVNFLTCCLEAGPAAPLIQAYDHRMFSSGIHGAWRWIWKPMSPCSKRTGCPSPHRRA